MVSTILMCCAFLGTDDTPPVASPSAKPAIETYQAAQAKAGKNADRPGSPGALVRGARPVGRADEAPGLGGRVRPIPRTRAGSWDWSPIQFRAAGPGAVRPSASPGSSVGFSEIRRPADANSP